MKQNLFYWLPYFLLLLVFSCKAKDDPYKAAQQKLGPLYSLKGPSKEGDWLNTRPEKYQSFEEYVLAQPISADSSRKKIFIMLIGEFDSTQKGIAEITAQYLEIFYNLETVFIEMRKDSDIFTHSRKNKTQNHLQLSARQIMDTILKPQLPEDAAALIALTNYDLYPGNDWNFIFGLGSTKERVGVWSMYRFGDPHNSKEWSQCLMLTIKTATHEVGHMFTLSHCAKYECCMNGSNSLREANSQPVYFCPDCLVKICWNLKQDIKANLERTKQFWQQRNNSVLVNFYNKSITALK